MRSEEIVWHLGPHTIVNSTCNSCSRHCSGIHGQSKIFNNVRRGDWATELTIIANDKLFKKICIHLLYLREMRLK